MGGISNRLATIVTMAAIAFAAPVQADEAQDAARYVDCMAMVETHPETAFDTAVEWRGLGGGAPAEHCAGSALLVLGYYREAATRLEELAQQPALDGTLKPRLLQQAGQGWLLAGEAERAYAVLTAALDMQPANATLWLDRGAVLAEMELYEDAVVDLSRALTLSPTLADAWAFRGSAKRLMDQPASALSDLNEAIRLEPVHVEAYLERGNVRRLMGDDSGARNDWLAVIEIEPESDAAEAARANIERMDVDIDGQRGESE